MKELLKRNKDNSVLALLVFISLSTMWFTGATTLSSPKDMGFAIMSVSQNVLSSIGAFTGNAFDSLNKIVALEKENSELVVKLRNLESMAGDISTLRQENAYLRNVLQFSSQVTYQNLPVQIVAKAPGNLFNSLTINKGYNQGIRTGMPVVSLQDGVQGLIGRVEQVGPDTALILPMFDESMFVAARLETSRYEGLIKGAGNAMSPLLMQYIDLSAENFTKIGEHVETSGINSKYPPGIKIGTVSSINSRPYENSLELEITPLVSFSKIEYIFVILMNSGAEE